MDIEQYEKYIRKLTIEHCVRIYEILKEDYIYNIWDNFCTILSRMGGV